MNKSFCTLSICAIVLVTSACRPTPQPVPPASPAVPATVTVAVAPTATTTRAPTASPAPTLVPTATAPAAAATSAPTATATQILPTPTPQAAAKLQVVVNSPEVGYLNVRDAPAVSGALVAQTKDGTTLDVLDAASTAKSKIGQQDQWLKVRTPDGKEGFAAAWYLRLPGIQPMALPATPEPDPLSASSAFLNQTNALRAQKGLPPYRLANRLNAAAARHSQDMAQTDNIGHTGSDGSTVQQRVADTGYVSSAVAESILGGPLTIEQVFEALQAKPADLEALLSAQFSEMGANAAKGKEGKIYYTLVFAAPATVATPTASAASGAVLDLFNRTNALRAQNGLSPYRLSDKLNASAERHCQDMANTGNIDHAGSDGSTPKQRILDTGYEAQFTGEDIYGGGVTVEDTWGFWSTDPPHQATLVNQLYTDIGISVVKGQRGACYYTMDLAKPTSP